MRRTHAVADRGGLPDFEENMRRWKRCSAGVEIRWNLLERKAGCAYP